MIPSPVRSEPVEVKGLKDDIKEIRLLNRCLTWVDGVDGKPDKILWEADQRQTIENLPSGSIK